MTVFIDTSAVDCVSIEVMRRNGIQTVFAYDEHFRESGFQILGSSEGGF